MVEEGLRRGVVWFGRRRGASQRQGAAPGRPSPAGSDRSRSGGPKARLSINALSFPGDAIPTNNRMITSLLALAWPRMAVQAVDDRPLRAK